MKGFECPFQEYLWKLIKCYSDNGKRVPLEYFRLLVNVDYAEQLTMSNSDFDRGQESI